MQRSWMLAGVLVLSLTVGCKGPQHLPPTPVLFSLSGQRPYDATPESARSPVATILYATDRLPMASGSADAPLRYGSGRSASLTVGECDVTLGQDLSWDQLVAESTTVKRLFPLPVVVSEVRPAAHFAPTGGPPLELQSERPDGEPDTDRRAAAALHDLIEKRLRDSARKDAYVFVHGFNNTFDDGAGRMAQLWHSLGRRGVAILYTWPAGAPGLLRGYTRDRESGEFTVFHLKQFLRAAAGCAQLRRIHLVAHSRGCDVLTTALRELHLELGSDPQRTREELKIGHVVLAAPDLDVEVAGQRITAERLSLVGLTNTIYLNADDRALSLSTWLFESVRRFGQVRLSDLSEAQLAGYAQMDNVTFVDVQVQTDFLGHSYFISNPSVLSDLILLLGDDRAPGEEHGRPLRHLRSRFWELYDGYPARELPAARSPLRRGSPP